MIQSKQQDSYKRRKKNPLPHKREDFFLSISQQSMQQLQQSCNREGAGRWLAPPSQRHILSGCPVMKSRDTHLGTNVKLTKFDLVISTLIDRERSTATLPPSSTNVVISRSKIMSYLHTVTRETTPHSYPRPPFWPLTTMSDPNSPISRHRQGTGYSVPWQNYNKK